MKTTTIKIYSDNLPWWRACCKAKKLTSEKMFAAFRDAVKNKKQNAFYLTLPQISNYIKPLSGKRIEKKYTKSSGNI